MVVKIIFQSRERIGHWKKHQKLVTTPSKTLVIIIEWRRAHNALLKATPHAKNTREHKKAKKKMSSSSAHAPTNQTMMTSEQREQAFAMANQEMEYRVDLFNKLVHSCYEKCIDKRFKDGDLNVGETACVDRCSSKYWQSVGIVGQLLGANQAQQGPPATQ